MRWLILFYEIELYGTVPFTLFVFLVLGRAALAGGGRKEIARSAGSIGKGDALPRLAPLQCGSCGAAVPLAATTVACPHCGAKVAPPADWTETLAARARAARELRRAERMWRWLRIVSARPIPHLVALSSVVWWVASVVGATAGKVGTENLAIALATIWGFFILGLAVAFGSARSDLPELPRDAPSLDAPEIAACTGCGAPIRFDAQQIAATCGYCGAEEYRVALARRASTLAAKDEQRVAASLSAYVAKVDDTFTVAFGLFVVFVGLPALFGVAAIALGKVDAWLGGL